MSQCFDASRRQSKWLVAAVVPSVERQLLEKLNADEEALVKLLHRGHNEAGQAGSRINRIVVAYEAGRDGSWLARWLRVRDVEAYVIYPASVAVSREQRRAKTDRLDTCGLFSAGCAARSAIAPWWRSRRSRRRRTQGGRTASGKTWSPSKRGS
jgi:transposase